MSSLPYVFVLLSLVYLGFKTGSTASVRSIALCTMLYGASLTAMYFLVYNGMFGSTGNALADGLRYIFVCVIPGMTLVFAMWLGKGVTLLREKKRIVS